MQFITFGGGGTSKLKIGLGNLEYFVMFQTTNKLVT